MVHAHAIKTLEKQSKLWLTSSDRVTYTQTNITDTCITYTLSTKLNMMTKVGLLAPLPTTQVE